MAALVIATAYTIEMRAADELDPRSFVAIAALASVMACAAPDSTGDTIGETSGETSVGETSAGETTVGDTDSDLDGDGDGDVDEGDREGDETGDSLCTWSRMWAARIAAGGETVWSWTDDVHDQENTEGSGRAVAVNEAGEVWVGGAHGGLGLLVAFSSVGEPIHMADLGIEPTTTEWVSSILDHPMGLIVGGNAEMAGGRAATLEWFSPDLSFLAGGALDEGHRKDGQGTVFLALAPDGDFYAAGDLCAGACGVWLERRSSSDQTIWRQESTDAREGGMAVRQNGSVVLASKIIRDEQNPNARLVQFTPDGMPEWELEYPNDTIVALAVTTDDQIVVHGHDSRSVWIAMNQGNVELWRNDVEGNAGPLAAGLDGTYMVGSDVYPNMHSVGAFDADGEAIWVATLAEEVRGVTSIQATSDGGAALAGSAVICADR